MARGEEFQASLSGQGGKEKEQKRRQALREESPGIATCSILRPNEPSFLRDGSSSIEGCSVQTVPRMVKARD